MKVLILCTGNSCRSQMAEGILKFLDRRVEVFSAGTHPSAEVNPHAIKVMKEIGIDISGHFPKHVDQYLGQGFDYIVTVCDGAKESCPVFIGDVRHRLHIGFDDPALAAGDEEEVLATFRRVRDEIRRDFGRFYNEHIGFRSI